MSQLVECGRSWVVLKVNSLGQEEGLFIVAVFTCWTDLLPVGTLTAVRPLHILLLRFETPHRSQSTGGLPVLAWTGMQAESPLPVLGGVGCAATDVVVPIFPSVQIVVGWPLQILFLSSPSSSSSSPPPQASLLVGGRGGSCR